MERVRVEQRLADPVADDRRAPPPALADCLAMRNARWRRSEPAADGRGLVLEFDAPDADAVREAFRASGLPFERIWSTQPEAGSNDEVAAAWDGVLFDKFVRFKRVLTTGFAGHSDAALARHPVRVGGRVLDVGCGFGDVTVRLAAAVGPTGVARGVDIAPRFVDSAVVAAREAVTGNATFFCADVQTDALDGPYDLAFSRFGTMFFASPVAAMRNVARALAPGGRLCAIVWRRREDNAWVHVAETVVRALVPERHDTGEPTCGPGPFSMSSADVTSDVLSRAGFEDIAFERHDAPVCIGGDVEEAIAFALALGPAGEIMRLAGDEGERRRAEVVDALRRALHPYAGAQGVVMPSSAWIVTARRAASP